MHAQTRMHAHTSLQNASVCCTTARTIQSTCISRVVKSLAVPTLVLSGVSKVLSECVLFHRAQPYPGLQCLRPVVVEEPSLGEARETECEC